MILEAHFAAGYQCREPLRQAIDKQMASASMKVPMMPRVASKVLALRNDPNIGLSDVSELIHQDPSLAARVLKAANSAAYRGDREIGRLDEAVQRLGVSTLTELIFSALLRAGIFRVAGYEKAGDLLWRHALCSAYFGKEIACLRGESGDSLFLCGLLHAIGKPIVLQLLADVAKPLHFVLETGVCESLLEEFHGTMSTCIAQQWRLPQLVQCICAHYQNYAAAPAYREETAMTYLADRLATWVNTSGQIEDKTLQGEAVFKALDFGPDGIQWVLGLRTGVELQVAAIGA